MPYLQDHMSKQTRYERLNDLDNFHPAQKKFIWLNKVELTSYLYWVKVFQIMSIFHTLKLAHIEVNLVIY